MVAFHRRVAGNPRSGRACRWVQPRQRQLRKPLGLAPQRWYRKAADQGNADAQVNLGVMYSKGHDVTQNHAEALKWYRKAAEQGSAMAQYNMGVVYNSGLGVGKDYTQAVHWYRKAAEQGFIDAEYELGVMYESGKGVPQNYTEALAWYTKAAGQGSTRSPLAASAINENNATAAAHAKTTTENKPMDVNGVVQVCVKDVRAQAMRGRITYTASPRCGKTLMPSFLPMGASTTMPGLLESRMVSLGSKSVSPNMELACLMCSKSEPLQQLAALA